MYKIAKYLTKEERTRAVQFSYSKDSECGYPRDSEGYCPMGRALQFRLPDDLRDSNDSLYLRTPAKYMIARLVIGPSVSNYDHTESSHQYAEVYQAATEFTEDWDYGKIKNLAKALGVTF